MHTAVCLLSVGTYMNYITYIPIMWQLYELDSQQKATCPYSGGSIDLHIQIDR